MVENLGRVSIDDNIDFSLPYLNNILLYNDTDGCSLKSDKKIIVS